MKVMNDGFIYKLVDRDTAKSIFLLGLFELYIIWANDSETLVTSWTMLSNALDNGYDVGIEVGHIGVEQLINYTHESN